MPTTKKRTNIILTDTMDNVLTFLSKRDDVSKSAKAVQLIEMAIHLEEDEAWNALAQARDTKSAKFISHKNVWK